MAKTKGIVFHRPNARNYLPPAELPGIERVMFAKLQGVWLQDDLGFRKHIDYVMHICNQHTYLLAQLNRRGLPIAQMQKVFGAIILARVLYPAPTWRGYLTSSEINCLQHFLDKAKRWNITTSSYNIEELYDLETAGS